MGGMGGYGRGSMFGGYGRRGFWWFFHT
jgi:hypothetical protein